MKPLLLLAFTLLPCRAQFRNIEIAFDGIGCASCIESLPSRMQRIRGVESATVDAAQGVQKLQLTEQNRVRLEQIRDAIEQDGTKAKTARVVIKGALTKQDSTWILKADGVASAYEVTVPEPIEPGIYTVSAEAKVLRPETGPIRLIPSKIHSD